MNFGKSALFVVGEVPNIDMLATDLACRVGALPISYLGLPLRASFKKKEVWNPFVDRIHKRLSGWKA